MRGTGTATFQFTGEQPDVAAAGGCQGWFECLLAGSVDGAVLLGAAALVVIFVGLIFIPDAREHCRRERKETRAERDAFDRFAARARQISPSDGESATPVPDGPLLHRSASPESSSLADVRAAYRDTVMEVPHFDQYDESLAEHMAAEFGTDIAAGVTTSETLTPPVKRGMVHAAVEARDRREKLLGVLDIEEGSLEDHEVTLAAAEDRIERVSEPLCADQSYEQLTTARQTLDTCRDDIDEACEQRQADRREAQLTSLRLQDDFDLQEYLYSSMDVTYPVLADATRLLSQIRTAERHIEDELIYRG